MSLPFFFPFFSVFVRLEAPVPWTSFFWEYRVTDSLSTWPLLSLLAKIDFFFHDTLSLAVKHRQRSPMMADPFSLRRPELGGKAEKTVS